MPFVGEEDVCGVEFPQEMIFSDVKKQFMERKLSLKKTCHILEEREMDEEKWNPIFVWMRGKKFSLASDETAMMNAYLLLLILFILTWSKKRVCRAKFVSFLINIFATYCNTLSVNNEMKMRCCRFCNVLWAEGEGESERLWQLVCAFSLSLLFMTF